jgi:hypothetical protein
MNWIEILIGVLSSGVLALIGFVWRWSHKITAMENDVNDHKRRLRKIEMENDKVNDKMYSIVKDRSEFLRRGERQN